MKGTRMNKVRQCWDKGQPVVAGWLQLGGLLHAESLATCGYDALVIDMQHSVTDFPTALAMMAVIEKGGVEPFVRMQWNDQGDVMKMLDAGAYGVIVPMVEDAGQARSFASALRYPPHGTRSYGPRRPAIRYGADYMSAAAESVVSFVMIETRKGLDNLEEILAVDGIDGVFIGPADLALALGCAPKPDSNEPQVVEAVKKILQATHAAGKRAGIFCGSGAGAHQRIKQGFDFVSCTPDLAMLTDMARRSVKEARNGVEA